MTAGSARGKARRSPGVTGVESAGAAARAGVAAAGASVARAGAPVGFRRAAALVPARPHRPV